MIRVEGPLYEEDIYEENRLINIINIYNSNFYTGSSLLYEGLLLLPCHPYLQCHALA